MAMMITPMMIAINPWVRAPAPVTSRVDLENLAPRSVRISTIPMTIKNANNNSADHPSSFLLETWTGLGLIIYNKKKK
jgi:hypothetical protein